MSKQRMAYRGNELVRFTRVTAAGKVAVSERLTGKWKHKLYDEAGAMGVLQ